MTVYDLRKYLERQPDDREVVIRKDNRRLNQVSFMPVQYVGVSQLEAMDNFKNEDNQLVTGDVVSIEFAS